MMFGWLLVIIVVLIIAFAPDGAESGEYAPRSMQELETIIQNGAEIMTRISRPWAERHCHWLSCRCDSCDYRHFEGEICDGYLATNWVELAKQIGEGSGERGRARERDKADNARAD